LSGDPSLLATGHLATALMMSLMMSLSSCAYRWGPSPQRSPSVERGHQHLRGLSFPVRLKGVSGPSVYDLSACLMEGVLKRGVEVTELKALISRGATLWVVKSALSPQVSELSLCLQLTATLSSAVATSLSQCDLTQPQLTQARLIESSSAGLSTLDEGLERTLASLCEALSEELSEVIFTRSRVEGRSRAAVQGEAH
jgi:hypothetical protein